MKLSKSGLDLIIKREGNILKAYKDTVGVWTIGVGHTSAAGEPKVVPGMTITKERSAQILLNDMRPIEADLNKLIKVHVTQNQYDAIVSVVFNCGPNFYKSTCMRKLNAGDYKGAAEAIMLWNKPPEIIGRRTTEKKQFLTPDASTSFGGAASTGTIAAGGTAIATHADKISWIEIAMYGAGTIAVAIAVYYFINWIKKHV